MNNGIGVTTQKCLYRKIIFSCVLISCSFFCFIPEKGLADELTEDSSLQVYLPREVTIKDNILKLGNIGVVRGPQALVTKANDIMLGRLSVPGQEIVIERNVVLSRLAACGIPASQVTMQGAEKITVRQRQNIIGADEFVKMAESFLKENFTGDSISGWNPVRKPKDLVISNPGKNIRFSSEFIQKGARNQVAVKITVFSDNKQIATRDVTFSLKYNNRTAVAIVDIPAGTIIDSENVKIEKNMSNFPEPEDWKPPYGLVAKRTLPAETVIQSHMLGAAQSPVVVKRNQNVVIRIEKPGFIITALGKAIEDGKVGEYVKIRNIDSQRIIVAKINSDMTVEPVF
jgi:flagella basal body P-ring formation protein FlgA